MASENRHKHCLREARKERLDGDVFGVPKTRPLQGGPHDAQWSLFMIASCGLQMSHESIIAVAIFNVNISRSCTCSPHMSSFVLQFSCAVLLRNIARFPSYNPRFSNVLFHPVSQFLVQFCMLLLVMSNIYY